MPTKEYYETHSDECKSHSKTYRDANKEKLSLKYKEYYEYNKDKIIERSKDKKKEYRDNNKVKINERAKEYNKEKITCECGAIFRRDSKFIHLQTSFKHKAFFENPLTSEF